MSGQSDTSSMTPSTGDNNINGGKPRDGGNKPKKSWKKGGKGKKGGNGGNGGNKKLTTSFKGSIDAMNGHVFQTHSESPPSTQFSKTCEELQKYATITYSHGTDIQYLIKNMSEFKLQVPPDPVTDASLTATEIWKHRVKLYITREDNYEENKAKLYEVIWSQCSPNMQSKVKTMTTYEDMDKKRCPLKMLEEIKGISYQFESHDYVYKSVHDAKKRYYSYVQKRHESDSTYLENFKNIIDIIKHYGATICTDPVLVLIELKKQDKLDSNGKIPRKNDSKGNKREPVTAQPGIAPYDECIPIVQERAYAYAFLANADPSRYKGILDDLHNDYMKGRDNYPDNLTSSYNLLIRYRVDKKQSKPNASNTGSDDETTFVNIENVTCYKCKAKGHYASSCPEEDNNNDNNISAQNQNVQPTAPGISATQMLCHAAEDSTKSGDLDIDWCWMMTDEPSLTAPKKYIDQPLTTTQQVVLAQGGKVDPHWILLDSQSTVDLFANPNLLRNVSHTSGPPLKCHCNGGIQYSTQKGYLPGYGEVWHNPNSLANILSLANVSKTNRVTLDTSKEQAFLVHRSDGSVLKFVQTTRGLYYHDIRWNRATTKGTLLIQTTDNNKKQFTPRQVKRADEAKRVYSMVGFPSQRDFVEMIRSGSLKDCPVTVDDAKIAVKIYGQDIGALKGKTTRRPTPHVPSTSIIPIPKKLLSLHKNVTLCADIFFMDKIAMFTTCSRALLFITTDFIKDKKLKETILPCIKRINSMYRNRGFNVQEIHADGEFSGLTKWTTNMGITMNVTSANEHVPEIERLIRVIKERIRSIMASLPFVYYPTLMKKHLFQHVVTWLNMFPRKGGISDHLSPRTLVTGTTLTFKNHCRVPFGTYCQTHDEPKHTNTPTPRTTGAIAMNAQGNKQGGYNFLSLNTGRLLKCRSWSELPMPPKVIKRVHDLGKRDIGIESDNDQVPASFVFRYLDKTIVPDYPVLHTNNSHPLDISPVSEGADTDDNYYAIMNESDEDTESNDDSSQESNEDDSSQKSDEDDTVSHDSSSNDEESGADTEEDEDLIEEHDEESGATPNEEEDEESEAIPKTELSEETDNEEEDRGLASDSNDEDYEEAGAEDASSGTPIPNHRYNLRRVGRTNFQHMFIQYDNSITPIAPIDLCDFNNRYGYATHIILTQMTARKGLKQFGERAAHAIVDEFQQMHDKVVFTPVSYNKLSFEDRKRALRAITLIKEKRCGTIKGRTVADGSSQRDYTAPSDAAAPTIATEALFLTCVIDAAEERDVATADITGAFLQAEIDEFVVIKFEDTMIDLLIRTDEMYAQFVHTFNNGKRILYASLNKAMYGCMKAARLFYDNLSNKLLKMKFVLNRYDECVANKMINGTQCTITWHVDDLKISHKDPKVVDQVIAELEEEYGTMNVTRGRTHPYLGMNITFTEDKKVVIEMKDYIKESIQEFPEDITGKVTSPAALHLFKTDDSNEKLNEEKRELFHRLVAKMLFVSNHGRPDIQVAIAFLTTRTSNADIDDWRKLKRMLQYLHGTIDKVLTLSASSTTIVKWWVDAAYAVHENMRSHSGGAMSMGQGVIKSKSSKQKLNTKSSTEAELVGAGDFSPYILWSRYFLIDQGWNIERNILFQDNQSAMLLERNGRRSSGIKTRHINIRYFFLKDRIASGEIELAYCPTDLMIGDFFTKPLQGKKFIYFRDLILGDSIDTYSPQERVGINDYKLKNSMDSKDKDSISNEVSSKYENDISLRVETVVEK